MHFVKNLFAGHEKNNHSWIGGFVPGGLVVAQVGGDVHYYTVCVSGLGSRKS